MSGTYDLERLLGFAGAEDYYFAAPLAFLPNLGDGDQLDRLRSRFVLLAFGQGRWENADESWRMAGALGAKGVPNRVDPWGREHDHDWPTWRAMLPVYLDELTR
jgi:esterase/lipase superfamily enzyme